MIRGDRQEGVGRWVGTERGGGGIEGLLKQQIL